MSVRFDHREPGTPEQAWREAAPWQGAAPLDLAVDRVVVLSAHPDDETLGAGGLIAHASAAGIPVSVIVVTDGEGSHPGSPDPAGVRRRRRAETIGALHRLALDPAVAFLGVADGGIREARAEVTDAVAAALAPYADERVMLVAPWWGDGHRDHRVLGEIAVSLAHTGVAVVGYPIWMWHWARPAEVDPSDWRILAPEESARIAKERAVTEYASQWEPTDDEGPILHANTLAHFARDVEVFVAPSARASEPGPSVADFEEFHARHDDPWGLESRWYERRKRALLLAALPRERFAAALELGCASGAVTRELAERAACVVAVDAAETALARARAHGAPSHVAFVRRELPEEWPEGTFDLVVLSELGYYWSAERLALALDRIEACATDDAVLVLCHWRAPIEGAPLTGDAVHAAVVRRGGWRRLSRHREESFVLDVLGRPGAHAAVPE
ncbi:bifunctional PIG-L family deacetylase/class I SAM-dependent methyltransferase [Microbacterium sp. SORGH_AS_0888]|uniref:bifunctional PIG-L family deacetylase/class I SAM-dependent methyltransferase n=1 Tax=Microbacterium sp. SORGH_AS_0888 TaxID=3041791 RepID=UPI002781C9C8|nr:bifunctional PIG-L family deacetylase/class I SAM-dependent methyltransferase [Microbacterium sp. SORGH_AS_0888]MDQ1130312.1 LmbE family N-acetylglucosaminyl deacetylase [Microbacterium sp. SORGH_AS_0888]